MNAEQLLQQAVVTLDKHKGKYIYYYIIKKHINSFLNILIQNMKKISSKENYIIQKS